MSSPNSRIARITALGENKIKNSEIELLVTQSGKQITDIMLLTIDDNGKINVIEKRGK